MFCCISKLNLKQYIKNYLWMFFDTQYNEDVIKVVKPTHSIINEFV